MRLLGGIVLLLLDQPAAAFIGGRRAAGQRQSVSVGRSCYLIKGSRPKAQPPTLATSLFSSKTATEEQSPTKQKRAVTFESPKFQVYIEDTDAYGVMYNSNYVRAYERALLRYAPRGSSSVNSNWILSSIHNQKFRSSPALGEEYVIRGELIDCVKDNDEFKQTWELELVSETASGFVVHNSAQTILTAGEKSFDSDQVSLEHNGKVIENRYIPYHDEFTHQQTNFGNISYIPLRNAMNFFERSRSDYLGGPNYLRKMQDEDDLIWVVTGVENGKLFANREGVEIEGSMDDISVDEYLPEDEMQYNGALRENTFPAEEVVVKTAFDVKRRGMIINCHHTLWLANGNQERLLAQATCTILALKGSTRRPTSKLPQWVLDKITS